MGNLLISAMFIIIGFVNIHAQWQSDFRLTNNAAYSSSTYNNTWCIGANGNSVHAVWTDLRDGNNEIYYKHSLDGGISWSADTRLTIDTASSWNTSLAVSGSLIHVVWIDNRNSNWEIYYKLSTDGGTNWGPDTRLTNNISFSEFPSVSAANSAVNVVWADNRDGNYEIYFKHSSDGGVSWSTDTRLTNNSAFSSTPSVSISGSDVYVVWRDFRDANYEIYFKHSTDGGVSWGADTRLSINVADSGDPAVSASGSNLSVVWMDSRSGNYEIYCKRSIDGGISWGLDTPITNNPSDPASPSIAVSGPVVHVAWQDYRDGNSEIYYKRSTDAGFSWGTDLRLTSNSAVSEIPSVTVSGQVVHVLWTDERDGNREMYYKRNPTGNPVGIININSEIPKEFSLSQNYPNPFNPSTKIRFSIPAGSVHASDNVRLAVFDVTGREAAVLVNEQLAPGVYEFDFDAAVLTSGVYYYMLSAGDYTETKKMILIK